jgi:hypothetical protein
MSYVLYFLHFLSFIYSHCVFCWGGGGGGGGHLLLSELKDNRRVYMMSISFSFTLCGRTSVGCVQMSIRSCCRSRAVMDRSSTYKIRCIDKSLIYPTAIICNNGQPTNNITTPDVYV